MRKSLGIVLGVLLVIITAFATWLLSCPREPIYEGQPVGYWLENPPEGGSFNFMPSAHQPKMDSNAIPFLLRATRRRAGTFDGAYKWTWDKSPRRVQRHLPRPIGGNPVSIRANAVRTLGDMRANSPNVVAALLSVLKKDDANLVRTYAVESLQVIGKGNPNVTQAIVEALKDRAPEVRDAAADALWQLDPEVAKSQLKK